MLNKNKINKKYFVFSLERKDFYIINLTICYNRFCYHTICPPRTIHRHLVLVAQGGACLKLKNFYIITFVKLTHNCKKDYLLNNPITIYSEISLRLVNTYK